MTKTGLEELVSDGTKGRSSLVSISETALQGLIVQK
eukprot:CAMPEP_0197256844 /NCGR_PEP_ID=MMETSP1429-20130617/76767_1 /TAXON_ID=49237 /ORGANISM="Chaetoceros  sp., Strain UNC1202" /LENGTH=35 /DNA_ID= /DNA_START= /DNA_END= /DNA_ORIENTATION=